jgi:hypothetical protein
LWHGAPDPHAAKAKERRRDAMFTFHTVRGTIPGGGVLFLFCSLSALVSFKGAFLGERRSPENT